MARGPKSPEHAERCRGYAEQLIPLLRDRARTLGYALGVHGSLARDIDLIACPWSADAVPAGELAEALRQIGEAAVEWCWMDEHEAGDEYHAKGCPGMKPHGRLVWSFYLPGGPYIDLSVMPRVPDLYRNPPAQLDQLPELVAVNSGREKKGG